MTAVQASIYNSICTSLANSITAPFGTRFSSHTFHIFPPSVEPSFDVINILNQHFNQTNKMHVKCFRIFRSHRWMRFVQQMSVAANVLHLISHIISSYLFTKWECLQQNSVTPNVLHLLFGSGPRSVHKSEESQCALNIQHALILGVYDTQNSFVVAKQYSSGSSSQINKRQTITRTAENNVVKMIQEHRAANTTTIVDFTI